MLKELLAEKKQLRMIVASLVSDAENIKTHLNRLAQIERELKDLGH
jgi:hypothetical protein